MIRVAAFTLISFCCWFLACKEQGKGNLLPQLIESDSAVVMYYHTAGDPRFFNMKKVQDKEFISLIASAVNRNTIKAKDSCTTQGKIYFYGKAGAVETIYFSRANDCMTLSFIKTGEKYFTNMSTEIKETLNELEKHVTVLPGRKE
jgi:hypothetical protein